MPPSTPVVFMCGVTGNQGEALAKELLRLGWNVRATVRDLEAPKVKALRAAGLQPILGDWDDDEALRIGLSGCTKLFLNTVTTVDDLDRERRQAARIINAAKAAGVQQVVSSTSLGVSLFKATGHLQDVLEPGTHLYDIIEVKHDIEAMVRAGGFASHALLRPGLFMSNFLSPSLEAAYAEIATRGTWTTVLRADARLGLVDHEDIARAAAACFRDPERASSFSSFFSSGGSGSGSGSGAAVGIVSEFLTPQETLDRLAHAAGRRPGELRAVCLDADDAARLPPAAFRYPNSLGDRCFEYMPELVDARDMAALVPSPTSFREFLEREKDRVGRVRCDDCN
ncbi:putative family protein [Rosellinia necatrix]|uniref:Putative family protein n=1 Tax=Rosellinia necatrix TaxID=77044 RepID=A0A1W2TNS2_ROSNE|nr:putative family protein [Rosellinia necatrix]